MHKLNEYKNNTNQESRIAWMLILAFIFFQILILTIGFSRYSMQIMPMSAILLGIYLYFKNPEMYIGFTFWMHFISPEIQRFIDFKINSINHGYLTFTANSVTLISAFTLIQYSTKIPYQKLSPFLFTLSASVYSLFISLIKSPPQDLILIEQFSALVGPILFGLHIYLHWKRYPTFKSVTENTILWGSLVLGIYGVLQFVFAPGWDTHWLRSVEKWSYGLPEAFAIRIWSGTTDFQTFATTVLIGLMILLYRFDWPLRIPTLSLAGLGLLLSQARAAWLCFLITLTIFLFRTKIRIKFRILAIILLLIITTSVLILTNDILYEKVASRLLSLFLYEDDISVNIRQELYNTYFDSAISQFIGVGLAGSLDLGDFNIVDAPIFIYLFYFGWIGIIPYVVGLLALVLKLCRSSPKDYLSLFSQAFVIGTMSIIAFNNVLMATLGFYFWSFLTLGLASQKYFQMAETATSPHRRLEAM
ncbi:O-antigen ligase family protein [Acaryochloris marina]|nr:O-antigen ligase family protein [Acaryochloris marina]